MPAFQGPWGIICAMPEEVEKYILAFGCQYQITHRSGMSFYQGELHNKPVIVVQCGVGKVHAAVCTQILIDHYQTKALLFSGVAGALAPDLEIGDIIVSQDAIQHDMNVTALGFAHGQIPWTDWRIFESDLAIAQNCIQAALALNFKARLGRVLSGDQFVASQAQAEFLRHELNGDCVEMEAGAVGQVCRLNGDIPFLTLRAISDKADHSAHVDFPTFCKEAADKAAKIILQVLKNYD